MTERTRRKASSCLGSMRNARLMMSVSMVKSQGGRDSLLQDTMTLKKLPGLERYQGS